MRGIVGIERRLKRKVFRKQLWDPININSTTRAHAARVSPRDFESESKSESGGFPDTLDPASLAVASEKNCRDDVRNARLLIQDTKRSGFSDSKILRIDFTRATRGKKPRKPRFYRLMSPGIIDTRAGILPARRAYFAIFVGRDARCEGNITLRETD